MAQDPTGGDTQTWLDVAKMVWPTGWPVGALASVIAYFKFIMPRKDRVAEARAGRVSEEAKALTAEQKRLDDADAAQLGRHTAEVLDLRAQNVAVRVEAERNVAWWKKDSAYGWAGATRGMNLANDIRHEANNIISELVLRLNAAGAPLAEKPPALPVVPDIETLTGRNGNMGYL